MVTNCNQCDITDPAVVEQLIEDVDLVVVQASTRSQVSGYTNREHYKKIVTVSTERKQACLTYRLSRKERHPRPLLECHQPEKKLLYCIIHRYYPEFRAYMSDQGAHYHSMYKRNSMNSLNVVDWSIVFYVYNAVPATAHQRAGFHPS